MKILFVVNNAGFFCSHRLPLALAARQAGHEVALLTGHGGSPTLESPALEKLERHGLRHWQVAFRSGGVLPWVEAVGLVQMIARMRRWRPDVVHCVTPKGILYGGLAARVTRSGGLLLAVSGMGSLFTGDDRRLLGRLVRRAYFRVARLAYEHPNCRVIVQNKDDLELLVSQHLASREAITLIPGSGVPLKDYEGLDWHGRAELVIMPARLIRDKGVFEFVGAARQLRTAGCRWRFALVGTDDSDNPTSVPLTQIEAWVKEGHVEWWGHREDMVSVFGQAKIVCLPSYREGMPKALLEAAAAGCAVVTTDAVGCRESVLPGVSGDLVPVRDVRALAHALRLLIEDPVRQAAYGAAGRRLARERFSLDAVIASTLAVYERLEAGRRRGAR